MHPRIIVRDFRFQSQSCSDIIGSQIFFSPSLCIILWSYTSKVQQLAPEKLAFPKGKVVFHSSFFQWLRESSDSTGVYNFHILCYIHCIGLHESISLLDLDSEVRTGKFSLWSYFPCPKITIPGGSQRAGCHKNWCYGEWPEVGRPVGSLALGTSDFCSQFGAKNWTLMKFITSFAKFKTPQGWWNT